MTAECLLNFPVFTCCEPKNVFFFLQNNFLFTPGKFREMQLKQQETNRQVCAWLKKNMQLQAVVYFFDL